MDTISAACTDSTLVGEARKGNEQAFAVLIDRHRSLVFGTTWAALQDYDDTEDATQESFVLAYRHLDDLKNPAKFSSWIYSIALNVARKWLGKRVLEQRRREDLSASWERPAEYHKDACDTKSQQRAELKRAFGALSSEDRTAITLFYLVGLDQKQIAQTLEIPVGTVKSRLHRSRNQLRRRLLQMAKENFAAHASREDYGRAVIGGMRGVIHWQRLLQEEGLEGWQPGKPEEEASWMRSGDAIIGEDAEGEEGKQLFIGDHSWKDYELSVLITPISGGNAQVLFRVSEDRRSWYLFDFLLGWQAIAISQVDPSGLQKLSVVNYPIESGQEYDVQIAAREKSLTSYVDGKLINQVTDSSYRSGPIALNVWESKTAFRDPRIRSMH